MRKYLEFSIDILQCTFKDWEDRGYFCFILKPMNLRLYKLTIDNFIYEYFILYSSCFTFSLISPLIVEAMLPTKNC